MPNLEKKQERRQREMLQDKDMIMTLLMLSFKPKTHLLNMQNSI